MFLRHSQQSLINITLLTANYLASIFSRSTSGRHVRLQKQQSLPWNRNIADIKLNTKPEQSCSEILPFLVWNSNHDGHMLTFQVCTEYRCCLVLAATSRCWVSAVSTCCVEPGRNILLDTLRCGWDITLWCKGVSCLGKVLLWLLHVHCKFRMDLGMLALVRVHVWWNAVMYASQMFTKHLWPGYERKILPGQILNLAHNTTVS